MLHLIFMLILIPVLIIAAFWTVWLFFAAMALWCEFLAFLPNLVIWPLIWLWKKLVSGHHRRGKDSSDHLPRLASQPGRRSHFGRPLRASAVPTGTAPSSDVRGPVDAPPYL
jgi:hypothetical protein